MSPRDKIIQRGSDSLSDTELLSIMVGSGIADRGYRQIAEELVKYLKVKIADNAVISAQDLKSIRGVGDSIATTVVAGIELGRRLYDVSYRHKPKINTTEDAYRYFLELGDKSQEHVVAVYVNARYEMLTKKRIAIGDINRVGLNIRTIMKYALELNAYGVIIGHNHPSGDPAPSNSDILATNELKKACQMFDICLLDHLIIAKSGYASVPM